jgi:pimeloyl-ACP methyl ester carboxylesterase
MIENLPPELWKVLKIQIREVMNVDPADFLTRVNCPVLAIFGQEDKTTPVSKSVKLYRQYLGEAGNEDYEIVVFPGAGHNIQVDEDYAPDCFDTLSDWLKGISW